MDTLSSGQTGANEADETTPRLVGRDAYKGPAGQGRRLWTASRGVASSAPGRAAPTPLTLLVDSLLGRRSGGARYSGLSPEKKGSGPSSFGPGPRVPRARSAHPESPPRGRAPKGSSGGPNVLSALGQFAPDGLCTAERLTPVREQRQKEGPAGVSSSAGPCVTASTRNVTLWPSPVNCLAQVRGARSFFAVEAPGKGACSLG